MQSSQKTGHPISKKVWHEYDRKPHRNQRKRDGLIHSEPDCKVHLPYMWRPYLRTPWPVSDLQKGMTLSHSTHRTLPAPPFHHSPDPGHRSCIHHLPNIKIQTTATIRKPHSSPEKLPGSKTCQGCGQNISRDLKLPNLIDKHHQEFSIPDHPSTEFKP